jgi:hypothetical protein
MYAVGYKICMQKVADLIGAKDVKDPLVDTAIHEIFGRLNRSAYLRIEAGFEAPGPDGKRKLIIIIALAIGHDEHELREMDLGELDISIKEALPHVLVGPGVWEISD